MSLTFFRSQVVVGLRMLGHRLLRLLSIVFLDTKGIGRTCWIFGLNIFGSDLDLRVYRVFGSQVCWVIDSPDCTFLVCGYV